MGISGSSTVTTTFGYETSNTISESIEKTTTVTISAVCPNMEGEPISLYQWVMDGEREADRA